MRQLSNRNHRPQPYTLRKPMSQSVSQWEECYHDCYSYIHTSHYNSNTNLKELMEAEDDDEGADWLDIGVDSKVQPNNNRVNEHAKLKNMRDHRRTYTVDLQLQYWKQ